jgi:hypothetical protein
MTAISTSSSFDLGQRYASRRSELRPDKYGLLEQDWGGNHQTLMNTFFKNILGFTGSLLLVSAASAQNYSIDWSVIGGGGGTCTAGVYSVSGTIGQHDAGGPMTNGNFSLTGGFWSLYAVQTPGAPVLGIKLTTPNTAMVYWPSPSTGFNLQVNTNLATTNWVTPAGSVTDDGTIKYIMVNPPGGNRFYRLLKP